MPWPLEEAWTRLNAELHRRLGPDRYALWIRHVRPALLDEEEFVFHIDGSAADDRIETLFGDAAHDAARRVTNRNVRVRFAVESGSFAPSDPAARAGGPEHSFRAFIAGRGNRVALAAARAFAASPRRSLLIHAPSGLGKTHLLEAIGTELARRSALRILRLGGDPFRRQFARAREEGRLEAFLGKSHGADVLLFDDLNLLCGRPDAQDALVRMILALEERGGRVALTSRGHPRGLEGLSRSARSRLRAEVEVTIDRPDASTGAQILRACAPPGTPAAPLEYVAAHIQSNHTDQLHCLARLLELGTVTEASARAVVGEFLNEWSRGLTYADIVRAAAADFGVSATRIYSDDRDRAASDARQACYFLSRKLLAKPFAQIGDHFGGRDHATVIEACRKLSRRRGASSDRLRRLERRLLSPEVAGL